MNAPIPWYNYTKEWGESQHKNKKNPNVYKGLRVVLVIIFRECRLREYAAKHAGVIYIEADATTQNTKAILEEIWKAIGKRNPEPERYMKEGIIDELRDSGRLIIIDEANQLNHKALEAIRALHDKGNMGIVLAGNSIIYERINSRNDTLYAQIVCRIGIRKHIFGRIAKSDIESLFEQKKLSTRCTDYLHQLANGKGGLTYMIKIYLLAEAAARSHKEELDVKHLSMTHKMQSGQQY